MAPSIPQTLRPHPFVWADVFRGITVPAVRIDRGIPIAQVEGVTLTLNLYHPPFIGRHPAIAVIYGGAWQNGTPANNEIFSRYMAAQGYTVVALDYRHAPQFRFPAQLEDIRTALSFIQAQAEAFCGSPPACCIIKCRKSLVSFSWNVPQSSSFKVKL